MFTVFSKLETTGNLRVNCTHLLRSFPHRGEMIGSKSCTCKSGSSTRAHGMQTNPLRYLFSDWPKAYSEFSSLYNNHVKDTQGHG